MRLSTILLIAFCSTMISSHAQNVGIGNTSPNSKVDVSGDLALREGTAITVAAGANTLTLPTAKNSVYRLTGASGAFSITSISGGNDGMLLTLINATGQVMTVTNGTIQTNTGADLVASGTVSTVNLIYNATLGKWLVASGEGFNATGSTNIYNSDGTLTGNRTVTQGADNITFSATTGNLIFNPSSTGSMGVGTTSPGMKLDVASATNTNGTAAIRGTETGSSAQVFGVEGTVSSTATTAAGVYGYASASSAQTYGVFGEATSSNGTGVYGQADASSANAWGVNGYSNGAGVGVAGNANAAGGIGVWGFMNANGGIAVEGTNTVAGSNTNIAGYFSAQNGSANYAIIVPSGGGNVGIGTSTPSSTLQVSGKTTTTNFEMTSGATNGYVLQSDASGNGTWVNPTTFSAANIYNSNGTLTGNRTVTMSGNNLNFSGGNVCIGTATPNGTLSVMGKAIIGDNSLTNNDANDNLYLERVGSYTQIHLYNNDGSNTDINAYLSENTTGNGSGFGNNNPGLNLWTASAHPIRLATNATERLTILSGGNVGINNTNPGYTLAVGGTTSTTNLQMTTGATNGYILKSDASGNASWVNPTSITTGTTNTSTWTQSGGLVNTVNGVAATVTPASGTITNVLGYNSSGAPVYQAISGLVESVSNTVSGNNISTTVDGTTGTAVTVPNIYTSDGTIAATRTVTMGNNNLIFNTSGTGNVVVGTGDGGGAPIGGTLRGPNAGSGTTTGGGSLTLNAGYGYNGGAGGSVFINGGTTSGSGTNGNVYIRGGYTSPNQGAVYLNDNNGGTTFLNDAGGTVNIGRTTAGTGELNLLNGLTIDNAAANNGTISYNNSTTTGNGITFGSSSGEGIASNRASSTNGNQYGVDLYTNFTRRLSVTNTGYVGINNTVPSNTLNVGTTTNMGSGIDIGIPNDQYGNNGSSYAIRFYGYRDVTSYIITAKIAAQRTYQCCAGSGSTPWLEQGSDLVFSTTNAPATAGTAGAPADNTTERMRIKDNGNIGIGTSSPSYPLDIGTTVTGSLSGSYGYLAQSGAGTGGSGTGNQAISVHAAGRMFALEYDAQSDRRIKTALSHPDAASMLDQVNKLKVTDYRYIDKVARGDQPKRGFIAQEVEEVIPTAVHKNTDVIPSVFASAEKVSIANSTLTVTTAAAHGFAEGDEVLLYDKANKAYHVKVGLVLDERSFEVYDWTAQTDQIFVYGKKVNDFRAVDFDQITALAIGAVQELDKKVNKLEKERQELQSKNEKLERALNAIQAGKADASQLDQLKAEVETLKEIVGAKAQK